MPSSASLSEPPSGEEAPGLDSLSTSETSRDNPEVSEGEKDKSSEEEVSDFDCSKQTERSQRPGVGDKSGMPSREEVLDPRPEVLQRRTMVTDMVEEVGGLRRYVSLVDS